jgi:hypothetical protein
MRARWESVTKVLNSGTGRKGPAPEWVWEADPLTAKSYKGDACKPFEVLIAGIQLR